MKHRLLVLVVALSGAVAGQAAVLVTDLTGKAETADKRAVAVLSELGDGSRVTLAAGAQLVGTDLVSGREYLLKGPGQFRVEKAGVFDAAGAQVAQRVLPGSNLPDVKVAVARVAQATLAMRGGVFSSSAPSPLVPARTTVLTTTPVLKWSAVEGATSYRVSVLEGGSTLQQASTQETELTVPAALADGKPYTWRVEAMGAQGRIADASTTFSVVSAEQARVLQQLKPGAEAPYSQRVLYAAQLQEAGASDEAKKEWQALARERPEDPNLAKLAR